jgi:hypothetical protein
MVKLTAGGRRRRRITGCEGLESLIDLGLIKSGAIALECPGDANAGRRQPSRIIVSRPVLALLFEVNDAMRMATQ